MAHSISGEYSANTTLGFGPRRDAQHKFSLFVISTWFCEVFWISEQFRSTICWGTVSVDHVVNSTGARRDAADCGLADLDRAQ